MSVLKYVTDGDNAADNEDAHSIERKYAMRLYGFIGCGISNHGFCISLVSAFCHGLIRPIDLIINFGDKIAVKPGFGEFHCGQIRHNAVVDEGEQGLFEARCAFCFKRSCRIECIIRLVELVLCYR